MADRFWIGGTGSWSDASKHWASISGGSGAASNLPTINDNVRFDANSFDASGTITLDISANCLNFDWTGLDSSVWFSSAVQSAYIYGDVSLNQNLQWVFTGTAYTYLNGNDTSIYINSNTCVPNVNKLYVLGLNNTYTHLDNFSMIGSMHWRNGVWNTNNKDVSISAILSYDPTLSNIFNATYRFIWGSSIISCAQFDNNSNRPIDASNSTLIITSGWIRPKVNLNKVIINNPRAIYDSNTYEELILNYTQSTTTEFWQQPASTINKLILNCNNNIVLLTFGAHYSQYTLKNLIVNDISINNPNRLGFRDISAGGNISWDFSNLSGYSEDCDGNTGITFTPSTSCYYVHTSGACNYFDESKWKTMSGGTTTARIPLAQDDVIFDSNSFTGSSVLTINSPYRVGNLNMTNVNQNVTLKLIASTEFYGNLILGENVTPTSTYTLFMRSYGSVLINTYNKLLHSIYIYSGTGTLLSNISLRGRLQTDMHGSLDFNNYDVSCSILYGKSAVHGGTFWFRNSKINIFGNSGNVFYCPNNIYGDNYTITLNPMSGSSTISFGNNGSFNFNKIVFAGNHTGYFNDATWPLRSVNELVIMPGRKVQFGSSTSTYFKVNKFIASGTSDSSIYIGSTTSLPFILNASTGNTRMQLDHCFIQNASVGPINRWYARNSTDLGGNSGWNFKEYSLKPIRIGNKILNKHIEK